MNILDEVKYAKQTIEDQMFKDNIFDRMIQVARYLKHTTEMSDDDIFGTLDIMLIKSFDIFRGRDDTWDKRIRSAIEIGSKRPPHVIDCIPIYDYEIHVIEEINNKVLERLMFAVLVYSKYHAMVSPTNNPYVTVDLKELFVAANISANADEKLDLINQLYKKHMIELVRYSSTQFKPSIETMENDEIIYRVDDLRDLGMQYRLIQGENIVKCKGCGRFIKGNKNNSKKYCSACSNGANEPPKLAFCEECGWPILYKGKKPPRLCSQCRS